MKHKVLLAFMLVFLLLLYSCDGTKRYEENTDTENALTSYIESKYESEKQTDTAEDTDSVPAVTAEGAEITFFDVGKADFILIRCGGENMVIDSGYEENKKFVVEKLKENGVEKIKYLVATHPDKDHIGSMAKILTEIETECLYICPVEKNSDAYKNMMNAAEKNSVNMVVAECGDTLTLGDAVFDVISPNEKLVSDGDENEASIVMMMKYGMVRVLFCGDAQKNAEKEMLNSEYDLSADVIKIGHHGSNQSSCKEFLSRVGADYAVISTGIANGEKYISDKVIKKLESNNTKIFRTDLCGSVFMVTDGDKIEITTEY